MSASDAEVLEEARALYDDLDKTEASFRSDVERLVTESRKRRLAAAKAGYRQVSASTPRGQGPKRSLDEMLKIARVVFARRSDVPAALTFAFREGKGLSESDLETLLDDMRELGLLEEQSNKN